MTAPGPPFGPGVITPGQARRLNEIDRRSPGSHSLGAPAPFGGTFRGADGQVVVLPPPQAQAAEPEAGIDAELTAVGTTNYGGLGDFLYSWREVRYVSSAGWQPLAGGRTGTLNALPYPMQPFNYTGGPTDGRQRQRYRKGTVVRLLPIGATPTLPAVEYVFWAVHFAYMNMGGIVTPAGQEFLGWKRFHQGAYLDGRVRHVHGSPFNPHPLDPAISFADVPHFGSITAGSRWGAGDDWKVLQPGMSTQPFPELWGGSISYGSFGTPVPDGSGQMVSFNPVFVGHTFQDSPASAPHQWLAGRIASLPTGLMSQGGQPIPTDSFERCRWGEQAGKVVVWGAIAGNGGPRFHIPVSAAISVGEDMTLHFLNGRLIAAGAASFPPPPPFLPPPPSPPSPPPPLQMGAGDRSPYFPDLTDPYPWPQGGLPAVANDDGYSVYSGEELVAFRPDGVCANDNVPAGYSAVLTSGFVGSDTELTGQLLAFNGDGSFRYLAAAGSYVDTFTYLLSDGTAASAEATVTITVTPRTESPGLSPADSFGPQDQDWYTVAAGGALTGNVNRANAPPAGWWTERVAGPSAGTLGSSAVVAAATGGTVRRRATAPALSTPRAAWRAKAAVRPLRE